MIMRSLDQIPHRMFRLIHTWYHRSHNSHPPTNTPHRLYTIHRPYQRVLEELHISKSFSCPEDLDLAALHLSKNVQTSYSAATTHLSAPTSRRWDLPPRLQHAL
ncbi:hypothetical protein EVAR_36605_1 [Eumeta japonica]|uniref:Uncharacterized protein n=1 Tax=Eumeta variegata TaxID=151549 RepID=A0A4C1ZJH3_EUMVA|nr:hypothetical protein EVAR_36605_1 [Eumeta japonica]